MAVIDNVRLAAKRPDCIIALFPDDGGRVYSPLTEKFARMAKADIGVRDVDDGLIQYFGCTVDNGYFHALDNTIGNAVCCVRTGYSLGGEIAHHTMLTKMFIPSWTCTPDCGRHFIAPLWQGSSNSNGTWGLRVIYSAASDNMTLNSTAFLQNPEEYAGEVGSTASGYSITYSVSDLTDRWLVVASTISGDAGMCRLFLDGEHIGNHEFGFRASANGVQRTIFRNNAIVNEYARNVKLGSEESNTTIGYAGVKFAWGIMFNSILPDHEIKNISE